LICLPTPSPFFKKGEKWDEDLIQRAEHPPSKHEALSSNLSTAKKKKKKKKKFKKGENNTCAIGLLPGLNELFHMKALQTDMPFHFL
jgi:hypothetical protein